jgi:hypothetical protein
MNFTNTDCAESIMLDFLWVGLLLDSRGNSQMHKQVNDGMNWQLSGQIFPIRNKIKQEINK